MRLYVIRHAKAENFAGSDFERVLTGRGREQASMLGKYLLEKSMVPDLVLSSPVLRAKETAEIMCEAMQMGAPILEPFLACGMQADVAKRELTAYKDIEAVAIVGHNPDLTYLIQEFSEAAVLPFRVKKGSVTILEPEEFDGEYRIEAHEEF
ncbi:SixA phosphatase family protein [Rubritalea tangerina]|uniref:SixA phosphatase family protein n=1 Tax=Rubritalea tangerina TaxID=430798 RepID=A0ABW4Z9S0_9BACT